MNEYSIDNLLKIYDSLEVALVTAMTVDLKRKKLSGLKPSEIAEWEKDQLSHINVFKRNTKKIISDYKKVLDSKTEKTMIELYKDAQSKELTRLIKNFGSSPKFGSVLSKIDISEVKGINDRRMVALLNAVLNDTNNCMTSIYRQIEDEYRQIIHNSAVEFNAGNKTIYQSIEMAEEDFLNHGIASIQYSDGRNVNIRSYAEMALRTNGQRAIIQGEAYLRDYIGITTVRVSHHGITCPKCAKWQGKILIDDVYQEARTGDPNAGKYPYLSTAIKSGLLHPNCRHSLISIDTDIDGDEPQQIVYSQEDAEKYKMQQKQRKLEREMRKLKRKRAAALNMDQINAVNEEIGKKNIQIREFLKEHKYLIRQREREQI